VKPSTPLKDRHGTAKASTGVKHKQNDSNRGIQGTNKMEVAHDIESKAMMYRLELYILAFHATALEAEHVVVGYSQDD
jgi:hypothetical protein